MGTINSNKEKFILVTGVAGFIGSNLEGSKILIQNIQL